MRAGVLVCVACSLGLSVHTAAGVHLFWRPAVRTLIGVGPV